MAKADGHSDEQTMFERIHEEYMENFDEEMELEYGDLSEDQISDEREASEKGEDTRKFRERYFKELHRLQIELVRLQEWVVESGHKLVVLFEGRDAAGKGGVIKRITQRLNPRVCRVAALPAPNDRERTQWYFQRYVAHLPSAGEIVLFDRSWYNRAGVERVMGFCSDSEYEEFFRSVPEFEKMLIRSGIQLVKFWFSITERGAAVSISVPYQRSSQIMEAESDGSAVASTLGRLHESQGSNAGT